MEFKELARLLLGGFVNQMNSGTEGPTLDETIGYYRPLVENDDQAYVLHLIDYWGNDLQSIFAKMDDVRLTIEVIDGKATVVDTPPLEIAEGRSKEDYYFKCGSYQYHPQDNTYWEPGSWELTYEAEHIDEEAP